MNQPTEHWLQPDGIDYRDYTYIDSAPPNEVAFDVLRRREDFRCACLQVDRGELDPKTAAEAFGLYRWKPYWEKSCDGDGKPTFLATHVSFYRPIQERTFRRVRVPQGSVALVVNVEQLKLSLMHEGAMLAAVEAKVKRRLKEIVDEEFVLNRPNTVPGTYRVNLAAAFQLHDLLVSGIEEDLIVHLVPHFEMYLPQFPHDSPLTTPQHVRNSKVRADKMFKMKDGHLRLCLAGNC